MKLDAKPLVEYRRFTTKRCFGVEMEVGNEKSREQIREIVRHASPKREVHVTDWAQSNDNNYWHVKWDATCGVLGRGHDNGWELASYVASGYKDVAHIAEVANAMREGGILVNQNCGLHIHADIHDFTADQAAVLVARWMKIEKTLIQAVAPHRMKSKYCRLLSDISKDKLDLKRQYDAPKFWRLVRPTNFHVHDNNQKKVALNMVNYTAAKSGHQNRCTVELRLPEGTLFGSDIRNWARCFLNFVDLCKLSEMPIELIPAPDPIEEIMQFFGLEDGANFYILSQGLYEAKLWLLKRMIAYGSPGLATLAKRKLEICAGIQK